jgi:hypothetical protein
VPFWAKKRESFFAAFGRGCLQEPVLHLEGGWAVNVFCCCFLYFFLFQNGFACFGCFDASPKYQKKPKKCFWFRETNKKKQPKQIEFLFVSVLIDHIFCLFQ